MEGQGKGGGARRSWTRHARQQTPQHGTAYKAKNSRLRRERPCMRGNITHMYQACFNRLQSRLRPSPSHTPADHGELHLQLSTGQLYGPGASLNLDLCVWLRSKGGRSSGSSSSTASATSSSSTCCAIEANDTNEPCDDPLHSLAGDPWLGGLVCSGLHTGRRGRHHPGLYFVITIMHLC